MDSNNNISEFAPSQSDVIQIEQEQVSVHATSTLSEGGTESNNDASQQEVIRSEEEEAMVTGFVINME